MIRILTERKKPLWHQIDSKEREGRYKEGLAKKKMQKAKYGPQLSNVGREIRNAQAQTKDASTAKSQLEKNRNLKKGDFAILFGANKYYRNRRRRSFNAHKK